MKIAFRLGGQSAPCQTSQWKRARRLLCRPFLLSADPKDQVLPGSLQSLVKAQPTTLIGAIGSALYSTI